MGKFSYQSGDTTFKGDFNIYQARHGGIMLLMGNTAVCLTQEQVNNLAIDCYSLAEFDFNSYKSFYENERQALNISAVKNQVCDHPSYERIKLEGGEEQCGVCWKYIE
jgi:hypothetical protein